MPFIGLGLHVLIALFFAVHAVRSGQNLYWLFILFSFPLLGSVVYFAVIYLPDSRLEHGARKAVAEAAKALDPGRELREAQSAFEYTPSAQNRMRLASALLAADDAKASAAHYEACLEGPLAADLDIRFGAAKAQHASGNHVEAIRHLQFIRESNPDFRAEQLSLLLARSLAGAARADDARREFESALARFGSFESKAEYFLWAVAAGDRETAAGLQPGIQACVDRWRRHTRQLNKPMLRRLEAAYASIRE